MRIPTQLTGFFEGTLAEGREPQAAVDEARRVYVTFGAGNAVYCCVSGDAGRTFGAPIKVGAAGELALGMRRGPRIAARGKTLAISAIYGREGRGRDGELLVWRSADGGKTWQGPATVNDAPGAAREGLHAMAAAPDGTLACVWLDLRNRGTELFTAFSRDRGATWSRNERVYRSPGGTICECCHPSAAYDGSGRLYVMWRNALAGARDMYLSTSSDGGRTFAAARKLGRGTWPLDACPMDGGALAVSPGGSAAAFWRRDHDMFVCAPGGAERRVGSGEQGWAAWGPGGAGLVWLQRRSGPLLFLPPGAREGAPRVIAAAADDPVIAAAPEGAGPLVVVWTGVRAGAASVQCAVLPR